MRNPLLEQQPLVPTEGISTTWAGVDHPEGLAVSQDGIVWAGGEEGAVYRGRLDESPEVVATLPGRTLGFCLDGLGNAYCADSTGPGIYRIDHRDGNVTTVSTGSDDQPARTPNHPAFLPSGVILWTDSGEWGADDGCVFATTPTGETRVVTREAPCFPNGIAVSEDGHSVAIVESREPRITVFSAEVDGHLSDPRFVAELPGSVPDGVVWDAMGGLVISCWVPDAIYVRRPDGRLELVAHDPLRFVLNQPTNIAFVPGTSTLVAANIGDRFLSVLEHDTPGAPVPAPILGST